MLKEHELEFQLAEYSGSSWLDLCKLSTIGNGKLKLKNLRDVEDFVPNPPASE